jgi:hypothetical protein
MEVINRLKQRIMKRFIYFAAAALCFAGCSDEKTEINITDAPFVKAAEHAIVFDHGGGTEAISVISGKSEASCEVEGDAWVSASLENRIVTISADVNNSGETRGAYIKLRVTDSGVEARDSIYVMQTAVSGYENLSAHGTANCYIAHTGNSYMFDASVKGNGESDGESLYIKNYGTEITDAAYADLVWEAVYDADRNLSRDIIAAAPAFRDGHIYFSTGNIEGNAVIAIKNTDGYILWSWHIWVTDRPVENVEGVGLEWMDRNLGALNNEPGDMRNRGMLYQWGRKDPFLPARAEYVESVFTPSEAANLPNEETGDGSATWVFDRQIHRHYVAPGNMQFAVERPTEFLLNEYDLDWFVSSESNPHLWGGEMYGKTIFDPCPVGYKVPESYVWDNNQSDWSVATNYGKTWDGVNGAFFPMAGIRDVITGELGYTGSLSMYWTSGDNEVSSAKMLYLANGNMSQYGGITPTLGRVYGGSVRCVAEINE